MSLTPKIGDHVLLEAVVVSPGDTYVGVKLDGALFNVVPRSIHSILPPEWEVGDEATLNAGHNPSPVIIVALHEDHAWVKEDGGGPSTVLVRQLSRP